SVMSVDSKQSERIQWQDTLHDPIPLRKQLKNRSNCNWVRFTFRELFTNSIDAIRRKQVTTDKTTTSPNTIHMQLKTIGDQIHFRIIDNGDGLTKQRFLDFMFTANASSNNASEFDQLTTGGKGDAKICLFCAH